MEMYWLAIGAGFLLALYKEWKSNKVFSKLDKEVDKLSKKVDDPDYLV